MSRYEDQSINQSTQVSLVGAMLLTGATYSENKPDGFYGPIAPPVSNAPSSECPELRSLHAAAPPVQSEYPTERRAAAAAPLPESP